MDDRKKQIIELERRKREQGVSLDALLVRFGEALLGRVPDSFEQESFGEIAVYRKLRKNIADSEAAIQAVEELICRFREIEESIEDKEREDTACSRELAVMYGKLGKILLDSPSDDAGFCAPYRDQANALTTKVLSLEERLSGLEGTESGNVFTWIGKGAQSLVLRSFLTKAQDNLEQLRRNVGERYSRWKTVKLPGAETGDETVSYGGIAEATEIEHICVTIEQKRAEARVLSLDLAELKEEKRKISDSFNAEGGPLKQIQTYKNHIAHVRDELKTLYRHIGAEAASIADGECRQDINSLILPEDTEIMDCVVRTNHLIHDDEIAIKKLQASLDIDDERTKIVKYRKMIQERREKIAQAEKNIVEFEESIKVSETNIEKLKELL